MAKSIQQAEAELKTAALDYAETYEAYSRAFDKNGDHRRAENAPLHHETAELCRTSSVKQNALCASASALADAIAAESRAEAL